MSESEAKRAARIELGGVEQTKDRVRATLSLGGEPMVNLLGGIANDVRFSFRLYRATPLATAFVVLVLAIALSFVTSFLSLWKELTLQPHRGFDDSGQLVTINPVAGMASLTLALVEEMDEQVSDLDGVAGLLSFPQGLEQEDVSEQVVTEVVTRGFFSELRPAIELGRGLLPSDHREDAVPVVVLSHSFWQTHFGGTVDAIGQSLRIRGPSFQVPGPDGPVSAAERVQEYRIVGVLAPSMSGTFRTDVALWMPYEQTAHAWWSSLDEAYRTAPLLYVVGRRLSDVNLESLEAELNARFADRGQEAGMPESRLQVISGVVEDALVKRENERQMRLFLLSTVLLAMVAAANASLFLFSRGPNRQRELGVRTTLGASPGRLVRQLATEGALLVIIATALAMVISIWLVAILGILEPFRALTSRGASPFDWRVLFLMAGGASLLTLLVSLGPIAGFQRASILASTKLATARPGWVQRIASTIQVALASVLTGIALAFVWYLVTIVTTDHGFDSRNLHAVIPVTTRPVGPPSAEAILAERERRRAAIEALPGVEAVGFATSVPGYSLPLIRTDVPRPQDPASDLTVLLESIDTELPSVMGMTLLAGRGLNASNLEGILVNETLAMRYWNRTDVIGEVLRVPQPSNQVWEVLGVVRDVTYGHPASEIEPTAYQLLTPISFLDRIVIRSPSATDDLERMLRAQTQAGNLDFDIIDVFSIADLWGEPLAADRVRTLITTVSATLIVLFAVLGFYGTLRYLVAAGRREFAIRSAVGAAPETIGRLVIWRGLQFGLPGLLVGSVLTFVSLTWLRADYFPLSVSPLSVACAVCAGIAFLILLASLGPSRQAREAQPELVLRQE